MSTRSPSGIIKRVHYPAGKRIVGKQRGQWMKLTDAEAQVVARLRAAAETA